MGLWKVVRCPACGARGAQQFLWRVKCSNKLCNKYSPDLAPSAPPAPPALKGDFNPGLNSIVVRYRNYANEERAFTGDRTTLRRRHAHISICLAPTGDRCSFLRERIVNLQEIESVMPPEETLTGVERQILRYHAKHGTTSPRLEEIRRKLTR